MIECGSDVGSARYYVIYASERIESSFDLYDRRAELEKKLKMDVDYNVNPAEIEANNPACADPTILTVEVEQFCS